MKKDKKIRQFKKRERRANDKRMYAGSHERKEPVVVHHKSVSEELETTGMRLNKYVAHAGICSRREADDLIKEGKVLVNGKPVLEPGFKVKRQDSVKYGGKLLDPEPKVYVLLNKPKDVVTTTDDPQGRQTVLHLVRNASDERIYPVGRLDRQTSGLLLLTNDGDLAQKLMHPKYEVRKIYYVELDKPLEKGHLTAIKNGITLDDGPVPVDDIDFADSRDHSKIGIELHIGRNRIVRRIFEHFGYRIQKLDRVVYANLTKRDLPRGKWRYLTPPEIIILKHFKP